MSNELTLNKNKNQLLYLSGVCFTAALGGFLFGFDTAVISGTVGFVKQEFAFGALMEGWFVSSALVGCIIGVLGSGSLSDRYGRKKVLILSAVLFLVSAIGSAIATTPFLLIIARMIGGLGVGIASMLSPMYISEISPPGIRGKMVSLYQFAITVGILLAYFSNAWLNGLSHSILLGDTGFLHWIIVDNVWRSMFGMECFPALGFLILMMFVPESPRWLIGHGQTEEGTEILQRVVGTDEARKEVSEIKKDLSKTGGSIWQMLQPGLRTALLIGILLPAFSQFSGINAIIYYGPKIFNQAGFTLSDALGGQVTIGIVNVLFTIVAIQYVDKMGRRPLLAVGITGVVISLILVGFFFYNDVTQGAWLLFFFLLFIACYAFSFGPVQFVIISEIFPNHIRGRAMSVAVLSLWGANIIVGQTFPWLLENVGSAGTFWLFGGICAPALLLVWKVIPETKGKSLEEIVKFWETQNA